MRLPSYEIYRECSFPLIDQMPGHWVEQKIKFQLEGCIAGGTPDSSNQIYWEESGDGVPWVSIADLTRSAIVMKTEKDISNLGIDVKRLQVVPEGTLLYSIFASLGKVAEAGVDLITNQAILALVPKSTLGKKYFKYWLQSIEGYLMYFSTSNTQHNLNTEKVKNLPLFLPSAVEQEKIANFLDHETTKIDTLIEKQQQLIKLLKEKRQAVISHAVTKGLNPNAPMRDSGVEWLGEVPVNWDVRRINLLFTESSGRAVTNEEIDYPVLSVSIHHGISDKELNEAELDRKIQRSEDKTLYKIVHENYLAYNMMRAWQGGFGASKLSGLVSPAYVVCKPKTLLDSYYFELVLRTPNAVTELKRYSRGITDFRLRLYWEEFKNINVPVPPQEEINAILKSITDISFTYDKLIKVSGRQVELLQERRTALISAAVTGKIDVRNWQPLESLNNQENNKDVAA